MTPDPLVHGTVWATTQTDSGGGILKTIDGGEHWNLTKVTNAFDVTAMAFKPGDPNIILTDGYFGFTDRINKTTDGGKTWQVKLPDVVATSFVFDPRNPNVVYASTEGSGIIRSTDCGETWEDYSAGIYYPVHYALAHYDNGSDLLLLTGSYGSGLYWIKPSLVVSGVAAESQATIPKEPHLDPCYPNPFNPTTTIHYDLPQRSHVTLEVYNTLGQKVAELVNAEKMAGSYHVTFNANGLASGVYLYRIQAGSFVETKKLVLLR